MPTTHGELWGRIISWENLLQAHYAARKGKRYRPETLRFGRNLEENITNIHNHLVWKSWRPSPWRQFWVYEPKSRLIQAPPYADRIVHHALVDVVEPFFEKKMVYHSYACRRDKGTHQAAARVQHDLRVATRNWGRAYVLQADISKYFPSINHDILIRVLARTIRDPDTLWLCDQIIRHSGYDHRGIPVGALTSQLFANVYLDQLDHRVKDDWGIRFYTRYMDDFVIVGRSKRDLWDLLHRIEAYLTTDLHLTLNPKTCIYPATGKLVDFVGYRTCTTHVLPRKRNVKRARRLFRVLSKKYRAGEIDMGYIHPRVMSFLGYVKHCDASRTTRAVLDGLALQYSWTNDLEAD